MGHAGAIVSGSHGTAKAKAEALEEKGVHVGRTPTEVAEVAVSLLGAAALDPPAPACRVRSPWLTSDPDPHDRGFEHRLASNGTAAGRDPGRAGAGAARRLRRLRCRAADAKRAALSRRAG